MLATTGSTIAVIPARVALMCRIEPTIRKNGTIVPSTTIQVISTQTGRCWSDRWPSSDTDLPGTSKGKLHHGWAIAQKIDANRNPQQRSETGSRLPTARSARSR